MGEVDHFVHMTHGNALRALCRFEDAVAAYRRASELAPASPDPWLNIAIAYLDATIYFKGDAGYLFKGLGSVTAHLLWASDGGPYRNVAHKIQLALKHHGREDLQQLFADCYDPNKYADDPERPQKHLRLLHGCVEATILKLKGPQKQAAVTPPPRP
jgi:hypothetical protein